MTSPNPGAARPRTLTLVTGIPKKAGVPKIDVAPAVLATYGAQVLRPGATATESLPDQQLGLAIVIPDRDTSGARCRMTRRIISPR